MHADHTLLEIAAHLMIAAFFIVIGIRNIPRSDQHIEKFRDLGIPFPAALLISGFATQFTGALSLALDVYPVIGAIMLLVYVVLALVLYHQYWRMTDPFLRITHQNYFWNNVGGMGGLLLVIQVNL